MTAEKVFPKSDGDILYASEVNSFESVKWNKLIYTTTAQPRAILAHTDTDWTIIDGTSSLITANSGVSWSAPNADNADMDGVSKVSRADGTKAISCDYNSANISITADSGDNWAAGSTDPLNITRVFDLSFPTATVAVAACDFGTADSGIFYSTDAGDSWAASDFPAAKCECIDMIDGSDGIAIHTDQSIYTTDDGGATWTDSTNEVSQAPKNQATIIALTTTTGVYLNDNASTVETFTTGAGGTTRLSINDAAEASSYLSNLCKTTNGNIYFVLYTIVDTDNVSCDMNLFRSTDDGVTWSMRPLGNSTFSDIADLDRNSKSHLVEYNTNKLLFIAGTFQLMVIDEN